MVGRFINFLLVPLYTYALSSVADYGVVSVMFTYASFLAIFFAAGLETAYFYFAKQEHKAPEAFANASWFTLIWGALLVLLAAFFQQEIMSFLGYPQHPKYALWFSLILAADALCALGFAKWRYQNFAIKFALVKLANIGVNVLFNLFFVLTCPYLISRGYTLSWYDPEKLVDYIFISNLVASIFTLLWFIPSWKLLSLGINKPLLKEMLKYGWPIIIIGLAGMVNETLDRALLKWLLPQDSADHEIGIYSAFYKLSLVLTLFIQAFRFAAEPFFFKTSSETNARHTYSRVMKWFVYFSGFIIVCTMAVLPWLAPLLIRNPDYFASPDGLNIVPVLLLANLFMGIFYNLNIWYKVTGKTKKGAGLALIGAAITIIFNLLFIPSYGFTASAIITLGAYATMAYVAWWMGKKHYPVPYDLKKLFGTISLVCWCIWGHYAWGHIFSYFAPFIYLFFIWIFELNEKRIGTRNQ